MNAGGLRMGAAEWGLLGLLSVLWGGSFFFGKVALAELPPLTVALARATLAAAALWGIVLARGARRTGMPWRAFVVMGFFNNVIPFVLMYWAMTRIGSGLAAILNATSPLWGALLAHWLTRDERLTPRRVLGILTGVAGVAVICGADALAGLGRDAVAQGAVVVGAFSYGIAGVYGRRFAGVSPWVTSCGQLTASAAMLVPLALLAERPWTLPLPGAATWGALAALALVSTALGYGLYFRILARAGATNALLVTLLIPGSALLLGGLVLGEQVTPRQLGGMALILAGLGVLDGRVLAWARAMLRRRQPLRAALPVPEGAGKS